MSKRNRKRKEKRFLGYTLPHGATRSVASLIEMTTGRLKVHQRFFKTEECFWDAIEFITGMRRDGEEGFISAVYRIQGIIGAHTPEWRARLVAKVDVRAFYEKIGLKLTETVTFEEIQANAARYGQKVVVPSRKPKQVRKAKLVAPTITTKEEFYKSWEWRTLRMEILKEQGRACKCCGSEPGMLDAAGNPVRIVVDHIKPLSKFWNLRLVKSNLQVLCDECNQGKGNWDQTDFREPAAPDEWLVDSPNVDPSILEQLSVHGETIQ